MGEGGVELPPVELSFHLFVGLADLEQAEGEASGPAVELLDVGPALGLGLPGLVLVPDVVGEPFELHPGERWDAGVHGEGVVAHVAGQLELGGPGDGSQERGVAAAGQPEAEGAGGVHQRQVEAVGRLVEAVGHVAQEERGGGAQDRQPELFDVGRAGIVAVLVEERVAPRRDADPVGGQGVDRGGKRHEVLRDGRPEPGWVTSGKAFRALSCIVMSVVNRWESSVWIDC